MEIGFKYATEGSTTHTLNSLFDFRSNLLSWTRCFFVFLFISVQILSISFQIVTVSLPVVLPTILLDGIKYKPLIFMNMLCALFQGAYKRDLSPGQTQFNQTWPNDRAIRIKFPICINSYVCLIRRLYHTRYGCIIPSH